MDKAIYRGDIYYADLDPVIGSEQGGLRPVLVLQNNIINEHSPTTIIAPITSQNKKKLSTHVSVKGMTLPMDSIILLEQVRTIDKSRLLNYIGQLEFDVMRKVSKAVSFAFDINRLPQFTGTGEKKND